MFDYCRANLHFYPEHEGFKAMIMKVISRLGGSPWLYPWLPWLEKLHSQWFYAIPLLHDYYYWLVVYLPLWKIWVRQLGWWNIPNIYIYIPIYGKIKFMFQTTNQAIIICMQYDHYHDIPTDGWFPMGNSRFFHQWPARLWAFFFTLGMGNSAFRMGKSSQVIYFCGPRIPWQTVTRGYNIPIDGWFPVKSPWKKSNQSSNWSFPKMLPSNPSH